MLRGRVRVRRRLIPPAVAAALAAALAGCGTTTTTAGPPAATAGRPGVPATGAPATGAPPPSIRPLPVVTSTAGLSPLAWSDPVERGDALVVRTSWGGCAGPPVAATATAAAGGVAVGIYDRRSAGQVCADFVVSGRVVLALPAGLAGRPVLGGGPTSLRAG